MTTAEQKIRLLEKEMFQEIDMVKKTQIGKSIIVFAESLFPDRKLQDEETQIILSCSYVIDSYCLNHSINVMTGESNQNLDLIERVKSKIDNLIELINQSVMPD